MCSSDLKPGDRVTIASERIAKLVNRVDTCAAAPRWTEGIGVLMANLSARGLLG